MGLGGFFKGLGKGLLAGGAGIAAPFTGGASLAAIPAILGGVGAVASGISGGRAAGREQEQRSNTLNDQNALDYARFNLQAPGMRAENAARGSLMANVQDVQLSRPRGGPGVQGGTRPSMLTPEARQLGQQMSRDALMQQMRGDVMPTPQPSAGKFDTLLNSLGYAGLIGQGMSQMLAPPKPMPTPRPQPMGPISENVKTNFFVDPRMYGQQPRPGASY